jgi:hypothetical protein
MNLKPQLPSVTSAIQYAFLRKVLVLSSLALTLVLTVLLLSLSERFHIGLLQAAAGIVFVLGMFFSTVTVREILYRMEEDQTLLFGNAVAHTFYGYALKLSFVPMIGPLMERHILKVKPKDPWASEDEN